jgi:hypothetical protein
MQAYLVERDTPGLDIESVSKAECSGLSNDVLLTSHADDDASTKTFQTVYQHLLATTTRATHHFLIVTDCTNLIFFVGGFWYEK